MGSKTASSLLFLTHTASSFCAFSILPEPGDICDLDLQCWQLPFIPIAFCIDEILLCMGGKYSIPILTNLPS